MEELRAAGSGSDRDGGNGRDAKTVVVRYGLMGYTGIFTYGDELKLAQCSSTVVIQTDRGIEIGQSLNLTCPMGCEPQVARRQIDSYVRASGADYLRPNAGRVLRVASGQDLEEQRRINAAAQQKLELCKQLARRHGLSMKLVACEHLFGGERIIFYFVADGRVDFRGLVRDLAREYQTRIEMRQIGARDEARLIADYEICGRQCCCKNFLKSLRPVSMKMAKIQKATLDPSKVSGRCGRLRCCLRYEQQTYEELEAALPRAGCVVRTGYGCGTVIDRQVLTQLVQVRLEDGRLLSIPVEELLEAEPPDEAAGKRATNGVETLQGPAPEPPDGPTRSDQTSQPGGRRGRGKRDGPGAAGS